MRRINRKQIEALLPQIPKDRNNAVDMGACVYVNSQGEHCIAGEIISLLGLSMPQTNNGIDRDIDTIPEVANGSVSFTKDAVVLLARLQSRADKIMQYSYVRKSQTAKNWGDVISAVVGK